MSSGFETIGEDMIDGVMKGYHGCIFAYGQTSSGKTHSIHGSPTQPGIVPQAVQYIFDYIEDHPNREFVLRVSYLEIYNEIINDLLNISGTRLRIRESRRKGVFVDGLKEEVVASSQQVLAVIAAGESHRHIGRTNYNAVSSRSHTLFRLVVESCSSSTKGEKSSGEKSPKGKSKQKKGQRILTSVLNIVDLAGSENAVKAGSASRVKETGYINKSLLTLGHVIFKLSENAKGHVPYRNSKLTHILQNSLSGRAFVSILCCMSPATSNVEETAQTLKFAARAKKIKNVVSINEKLDQATLLEKYREEIEGLKRDLAEAKNKIKAEDSNVDKEELRKLHEEREEFKQRIEQLTRIILTSSRTTERDLLDLMPQPESKTERRASMKDKLRRAKFSTLPRTFFSADSATDGELESRTQSSTGRDSSQLDNLDIKPEFETAEGRNNASARFQEMKREIENLKQVILDKELLLTKHEAERKRLATEVEKRDAALREWEAYYQAENNATVAASTVESPKSGDKDDTPGRKKSDLLETKDADFEAPLIDF